MVDIGHEIRYNPDWLDSEHAYIEGTVDKILRDEASDERFAYVVKSPSDPNKPLIPLSNIGEAGEYEVVSDE